MTKKLKFLTNEFFDRDAQVMAKDLIGKILYHRFEKKWLSARIIETESYYKNEKASHSSLGYTEARRAMFMPPGTIYMYYSRGKDSLNVSCQGEGNAVLIKSGYPWKGEFSDERNFEFLLENNPKKNGSLRRIENVCAG